MKSAQISVFPRARARGAPPPPPRRRQRPNIEEFSEVSAIREDRDPGDRDFLPPALAIIETPPARKRVVLGYALSGLIAAAIGWSFIGRVTIFAVAPGLVQPAGSAKVIEPLEGGKVKAIHVSDGKHVKAGDVLIELDPTEAIASRAVIAAKITALRAANARRRAEIAGARTNPINVHPPVQWDDAIPQAIREREEGVLKADLAVLAAALADLAEQRKAKETARDGLSANIDAQEALVGTLSKHVQMHVALESKGVESRALLLQSFQTLQRAQKGTTDLKGQLADTIAAIAVLDNDTAKTIQTFITNASNKLADADRQLDELAQQLAKADKSVADTTLRAPISGIVEAAAVTTVGQVLKSGEQLFQVVPEGTPLEIDAYVLNSDIGFVKAGQPAKIKVDTFPFTRYGTISGRVTTVATDAIPGIAALGQQKNASKPAVGGKLSATDAAEQMNDLVFPVTVAPSKSSIRVDGRDAPLRPGMSVVVEIETAEEPIIAYVLDPLRRGLLTATRHE